MILHHCFIVSIITTVCASAVNELGQFEQVSNLEKKFGIELYKC